MCNIPLRPHKYFQEVRLCSMADNIPDGRGKRFRFGRLILANLRPRKSRLIPRIHSIACLQPTHCSIIVALKYCMYKLSTCLFFQRVSSAVSTRRAYSQRNAASQFTATGAILGRLPPPRVYFLLDTNWLRLPLQHIRLVVNLRIARGTRLEIHLSGFTIHLSVFKVHVENAQ